MSAFIRFNKGLLKLPLGVQLWLMVLMAGNLVVPLVYLDRLEAQVVLATFIPSFLLMVLVTGLTGSPYGRRARALDSAVVFSVDQAREPAA